MKVVNSKLFLMLFGLLVSNLVMADNESNTTSSSNSVTDQNADNTSTADANINHFFVNAAFGLGIPDSEATTGIGGGPSWMANFGYNFNQTYAIEAGYTQVNPLTVAVPGAMVGAPLVDYDLFDIAFRPTLHLGQYFSFYGKLGGALEYANVSSTTGALGMSSPPGPSTTSFGALVGGGTSVNFGPVSLFLEIDQYLAMVGNSASTPANLTNLSLGLQYNF